MQPISRMIEWLLEQYPIGIFVEAGAHDGIGDSNTYKLEQNGWTGLCIEPSSAYRGLTLHRKCKVDNRCLSNYNGHISYLEVQGNQIELSGIQSEFGDEWDRSKYESKLLVKKCATLETMLFQHKIPSVFNFLCLDTEGSEYLILADHNFDKYRPKIALIEYNKVQERKTKLTELMTSKNYTIIDYTETDLLFKYNEEY